MSANRAQLISGLILINLGIAFLLAQYFDFGPGLFLTMLALVFLIPYIFTRSYGLLIPGCILAGIGLGLAFGHALARPDVAVSIGLGMSFIAIYVVQLLVTGVSHWWPLIPGGILVLVSIAEVVPQARQLLERGWPVILIVIGLGVLAAQMLQGTSGVRNTEQRS
jgi:hypothetical protein